MKNNASWVKIVGMVLAGMMVLLTGCGGGGTAVSSADTTAPTTTSVLAASGTTDTATTLSVTIDEDGTGYYLVQPAESNVPTVAEVEAGTSFAMTANVAATPSVELIFNTSYTIYFVAKDAAGNAQATVQNVSVTTAPTTTAKYVTQGGLTWMPVNFTDTWVNANTYCTTSTINGVGGWRMPTQAELSALYASGQITGSLWTLGVTWSSTSVNAGYHQFVSFYSAGLVGSYIDAQTGVYVSCVR